MSKTKQVFSLEKELDRHLDDTYRERSQSLIDHLVVALTSEEVVKRVRGYVKR